MIDSLNIKSNNNSLTIGRHIDTINIFHLNQKGVLRMHNTRKLGKIYRLTCYFLLPIFMVLIWIDSKTYLYTQEEKRKGC